MTEIIGSITSARVDWGKYIVNPRYVRRGNIISWYDYEKMWIGDFMSPDEFYYLVDKGQYTFQVYDDGGIIQLYYEFNGDRLNKANLAFYGPPREVNNIDIDYYESSELVSELETVDDDSEADGPEGYVNTETLLISPWVRLDYDPDADRGVLHGASHLHLNGLPGRRILANGVPGPAQFVEWVMAVFYPEAYKEHRLNDDWGFVDVEQPRSANTVSEVFESHVNYRYLAHLCIPCLER